MRSSTVIALTLMLIAATGLCEAQNLLSNPGFEPPATNDGLAQGWIGNVWGDCDTVFSLDRENPRSGETSQKIECLDRETGASQFLQPLDIKAGKRYVVRMWIRADGRVPEVGASLRHSPSPYTKHLRGTFEPGREWELFEIEGMALEDDDNAGLYIWFEAEPSGTVWIDDASVEVLEPQAQVGPVPDGNVIEHGSFEVDLAHTWDIRGTEPHWPCEQYVADGNSSIRFDLPPEGNVSFVTPCIEFNGAGERFSLGISAAATGAVELGVRLYSAVRMGQSGSALALDAQPGATLQRFVAEGEVEQSLNGAYYVTVSASAPEGGTLWLDALSLSAGGPEFDPAAPADASLTARPPANVFAPGEPVRMTLRVRAATQALKDTVTVRLRDYDERIVAEAPVDVNLARGKTVTRQVEVPVQKLGAFRADAYLGDDQEPLASMVLSVIPQPRDVPADESVIGGHFGTDSDWQMRIAKRLGYHWTRIHDCSHITHWRTVEPERGEWHFFDDQLQRVRGAGLHVLGEFLRVPDWATVAEEGSDAQRSGVGPYRDEDEFRRYVRTVVERYKPWINHWEVWNEPYLKGFYGGSAQDYARMAQVAAETAREADPDCLIVAPCCSPNVPDWAEDTLAARALAGADIFSYHGYACRSRRKYESVNEWARRDGDTMPRWNTETGLSAGTFYRHTPDLLENQYTRWLSAKPVDEAVNLSLQYFALSIASGSERYFYYWTNVESGMLPRLSSMSIYEWDRTIRPHGVVYAIAASLLDPCRGAGVEEYDSGVTACFLRTSERFAVLVWAEMKLAEGRFAVDLSDNTRVLDTMGNPVDFRGELAVGKAPTYVMAPQGSARELREALRGAFGD